MAEGKFVAYFRVSTERQGRSGLGLNAQRKALEDFLNGGSWTVVAEFTEIESGTNNARPELARAIQACRLYGAKLVIAKLDRLSRDAHFLLGLQKADVPFVATDMPFADNFTVGLMALVAQKEREMISARTKAALAQKKRYYEKLTEEQKSALQEQGKATQLGGRRTNGLVLTNEHSKKALAVRVAKAQRRALDLAPVIAELRAAGVEGLNPLARALTERGIPTARGSRTWTPMQVSRVVARI
jgi:DNA invertase Pin-like site-specific DNA recombinase